MLAITEHLVTIVLAFACKASADLQLMQMSVHNIVHDVSATQPQEGCRTSVAGDACYEKVLWVMRTGVLEHPEWYFPLTVYSSFEDFQRHLHGLSTLSDECPEPCAARAPEVPQTAREDCHTSVEGDVCFKEVVWAMRVGIVEHPKWYPSLTNRSSFEDVQQFLHGTRLSRVCPRPCVARVPGGSPSAQLPATEDCHTSVEGDACFKEVVWAMRTGIVEHPAWYPSLTNSSSFEDFQRFLHADARLSQVCREPCAVEAPQVPPSAQVQGCHTSVEGDACFEKVLWAMREGVVEHPDWYSPLTSSSSFEEFQWHLHGVARLSHVCPKPCPAQDCHTSVEGDACFKEVVWAMRTGIVEHPAWYPTLTSNSSFEDFQLFLSWSSSSSHVCRRPCAARASEAPPSPRLPAPEEGCRTSVEGDACFGEVTWAMRTGIVEHPEWYPSLTNSSRFEDFQRLLHGDARLSHVCPEPCAARSPEVQPSGARLPALEGGCHTSVEGDACFEKVLWTMRTGIVEHPDWYSPLTNSSSFEEFQRHLHGVARLSHVCPEPCPAQDCRTSVEGDACFKEVVWAMRTGIVEHPDWYPSLTNSSSFEDFQRLLHGDARLSSVCPKPCLAREPADRSWGASPDTMARASRSGPATPMPTALHVGTPMPTEMHEEDLLLDTYPGFEQVGRNCDCGEQIKNFSEEFASLELCAFECGLYPHCKAIGLHPWNSIWRGHCTLYKSACEDTNGWDPNTTCANPTPYGAISVNFNRVPTPAPTPAPTTPPDDCDVPDGSSPSSFYPCTCGSDICMLNEVCHIDKCEPIEFLKVEWPCTNPWIGSWYFSLYGVSATGAPAYANSDGTYIYWDSSCDGLVRYGDDRRPRWIFDDDAPNMTALNNLDSDVNCTYMAHHGGFEFHSAPLGNSSWYGECDSGKRNFTVPITFLPTLPTPIPTLESGKPCTCNPGTCGYFNYMDIDGDGCLMLPESEKIEQFVGHFAEMDADGDGCLTKEECANSTYANDLPSFPITGPLECDFGYYFMEGTSVCAQCLTGETRRRRSEACTECAPGKEDLGDFDNCISGVWMTDPVEVDSDLVFINKDTDESGIKLQKGDGITMSTRNPGHFERVIIIDKIGFNETARASPAHEHLLRTRGPFFVLDHGVHARFQKYDAIVSACTMVNGIDLSGQYPCGCGVEICELGQKCDEDCGNSLVGGNVTNEVVDDYLGTGFGNGGCCTGPPAPPPMPTPVPTVQAMGDPHLVNLQGEHFDVNHEGEFTLLRIPQDTNRPAEFALRATILAEHGKPCTTYITELELSGSWLGGKILQVRSYLRSHIKNVTDKFLGLRVLSDGAPAEAPWEKLAQWTDRTYVLSEPRAKGGVGVTLSKAQWHSKKHSREGAPSVAGQVEVQLHRGRSGTSAVLVARQDLPGQEHLNLVVRRISALGRADVGGLLGFDQHPGSLESVSPECQRHRDGLDGRSGTRFRPGWKTRWEKIREQRGQAHGDDNEAAANLNDNEASASLTSRDMMCVCPSEDALAEGMADGEDTDGVLADFRTARLAEATWD